MRFGYSSNAFVKFSIFESLEMIAKLGFRGIEIMCDRPHLYPLDFDENKLDRLQNLLEEKKLQVTNLNSFTLFAIGDTYLPSWIESQKARRQIRINHTLRCLQIASRIECKCISIPPGGPLENMTRKDALALFHQGLEQVIPLAEELGVKILVEPEPGLLMENSHQFKEFSRGLRSSAVGLNFDIGHFFCAGENPALAFNRAHNHLIPGRGCINFLEIFHSMRSMGYQGDISLELYPYVNMPTEAGRESLDYLLPLFKRADLQIEI
jgi:sugar phosphate isomerase/epimerase